MKHPFYTTLLASAIAVATLATYGRACPYCTVESQTLTEEIAASDVVVIARLTKPAAPVTEGPDDLGEFGVVDPETGKARFRIERVLLGKELLLGVEEIEAIFFGDPDEAKRYFIRGVGVDTIDWNIPMPLSDTAVEYIGQLEALPESGPDRLEFFLNYLQHEDPLLAQDAYDEFARAPYADLLGIAEKIDRAQLWNWIEDRDVSPSRRSLFFTMLGVCGGEEDRARLQALLQADERVLRAAAEASAAVALGLGGPIALPVAPELVAMEQRRKQLGFNAMIGCYLKLAGDEGLAVIDETILAEPNAHPTKVYGALIALRFLGEQTDDVPLDRLLESMRLLLDKPDFAEQVIPDLARWQDWSVLDRLTTMFKEADPKTYVKEPIVAYLEQARQQTGDVGERATSALAEIEQLDPETVKRARSLMAFGFLGRSQAAGGVAATDNPESDNEAVTEDQNAEEAVERPTPENSAQIASGPPIDATSDPAAAEPSEESTALEKPAPGRDFLTAETKPPLPRAIVLGTPVVVAAVMVVLVWVVLRGGV